MTPCACVDDVVLAEPSEVDCEVDGVCSDAAEVALEGEGEVEAGAGSEDFTGLTGPGRSSTLCLRGADPGRVGGISLEVDTVVGGGVVDTKRDPKG